MAPRGPCFMCKTAEGKYKCPRCDASTCSVVCSRLHRDNHPAVPKIEPATTVIPSPPQAQKPRGNKISDIVDTAEYQCLMQRYPDLEHYLWSIAMATDPPKANEGAPRKANQPWTQEEGMANGVVRMQSLRASPGDVRNAIREFCDLVTMFRMRLQEQDDELRRARAEHDAQIIKDLLRTEKS